MGFFGQILQAQADGLPPGDQVVVQGRPLRQTMHPDREQLAEGRPADLAGGPLVGQHPGEGGGLGQRGMVWVEPPHRAQRQRDYGYVGGEGNAPP